MAISRIKTNSIANDAITSDKLATGGIATVDMADGSVTSLKILDGAIATADIADSAITTAKLGTTLTVTHALGTASAPSITFTGDTNTGIFSPAADTIAFTEGGAEVARFDSSGNLGIGLTSYTGKLAVNGVIATYASTDNSYRGSMDVENGNLRFIAPPFASNPTNMVFHTGSGSTERMRILSDGKVGIGTTAPGTSLEINTASTVEGVRIRRFSGAYYSELRQTDNPEGLAFLVGDGSTVAERMRITGTGVLRFNSGYGSVATAFGCRAWVNFNAQGTPSIRSSGNVTSVTKQSTGNYTINFTTAMPDTNYSVVGGKSNISATHILPGVNLYADSAASSVMQVYESNGSFADSAQNFVAVFR